MNVPPGEYQRRARISLSRRLSLSSFPTHTLLIGLLLFNPATLVSKCPAVASTSGQMSCHTHQGWSWAAMKSLLHYQLTSQRPTLKTMEQLNSTIIILIMPPLPPPRPSSSLSVGLSSSLNPQIGFCQANPQGTLGSFRW